MDFSVFLKATPGSEISYASIYQTRFFVNPMQNNKIQQFSPVLVYYLSFIIKQYFYVLYITIFLLQCFKSYSFQCQHVDFNAQQLGLARLGIWYKSTYIYYTINLYKKKKMINDLPANLDIIRVGYNDSDHTNQKTKNILDARECCNLMILYIHIRVLYCTQYSVYLYI